MFIGGPLARLILSRYKWDESQDLVSEYYVGKSKLETCLGADLWQRLAGKRVLDFGCGPGEEVIELAQRSTAKQVVGLDINEKYLAHGRQRALETGVTDRCLFTNTAPAELVDVIISLDAFEHFSEPENILRTMYSLLAPGGVVLISFGPPWLHPWGYHCPVFPWAHLVLTERAVMEWRAQFKNDGCKLYSDGFGGVNRMTVARFERIVAESPFEMELIEPVPIRKLKWAHNRLTREFTTAVIRARLRKPLGN